MEHIKAIVDGILSRGQIRRGMVQHDFVARWKDVVGQPLASQTRPLRISGGILWVHVDSAVLRHHMTYLAPRILENIRSRVPDAEIYSIRFTFNTES